jgi:hypothetical protein
MNEQQNYIVRYSGARGPCLYDVDARDWVRDEDGQLVPADPNTGRALVESPEKCPTCKRPMPRKR